MRKGSFKPLLLDVNVLLAVAWPNHQFHVAATSRLDESADRWATCALTQLGFIRLSSNPAVVGVRKSPWEAAALLSLLLKDERHLYLDTLPSPVSKPVLSVFEKILGSQQVTDAYLLWLALDSNSKLLTFDSRIMALAAGVDVEILS
jgi:toxin-antitoxin system PIN domain toxin